METRRIVEEVNALLERERGRLGVLALVLLQQETLDQADAYRIAGVEEAVLGVKRRHELRCPRSVSKSDVRRRPR